MDNTVHLELPYLCAMLFEPKAVLRGHSGPVYTLAFHESEHLLYSGSSDGMVARWDLRSFSPDSFVVKVGKPVFSICFIDRHLLIGQGEGGIHVIDPEAKKEERLLAFHRLGVFDMKSVEQESIVLTAGGDGKLNVLDSADYRLLHSIQVSPLKMRCIVVAEEGNWVLTGGSDGMLRQFDARYLNEHQSIKAHDGGVYCICQLDNYTWVTGGRDAYLRFWNVNEGNIEPLQAIPAHNYAIYSIARNKVSHRIATASRDKTAKVWHLESLHQPERLARSGASGHTHSVNKVLFSPSGKEVITASDDRNIIVWSPSNE